MASEASAVDKRLTDLEEKYWRLLATVQALVVKEEQRQAGSSDYQVIPDPVTGAPAPSRPELPPVLPGIKGARSKRP